MKKQKIIPKENIMSYQNIDTNIYDYFVNATESYGNIPMLSYCGKLYTRDKIIKKTEEYIKRFNRMKLKKGDIVSFIMLDTPNTLFMWLALSKMGVIYNKIKYDASIEEIADILTKTKTKYLFVTDIPLIINKVNTSITNISTLKHVIFLSLFEELTEYQKLNLVVEVSQNKSINSSTNQITKEIEKVLTDMKQKEKESYFYKDDIRFMPYKDWLKYTKRGKELQESAKGEDISTIIYHDNLECLPITNIELNSNIYSQKLNISSFTYGKKALSIIPPSVAYYHNIIIDLITSGVLVILYPIPAYKEYPALLDKYKPNIFISTPSIYKEILSKRVPKNLSYLETPILIGASLTSEEETMINEYLRKMGSGNLICNNITKENFNKTKRKVLK